MNTITIELTDEQLKALECICMDPQEYIQNFCNVRAEKALADIVKKEIERRLEEGESIPQSKEEILAGSIPLKDQPQNTE